jgi:putative transposase
MAYAAITLSNSLGEHPQYLIRNWYSKYGSQFSAFATHLDIEVIKTPFRTPKANTLCERFMCSLKREYLNHSLATESNPISFA